MHRLFLCCLVALTACDTAFEGRGDAPEDVAAVFGVLDVRAAEQQVRLELVRTDPLRPREPAPLVATLADEATGGQTPATYRRVTLSDGTQADVAVFPVVPVAGHAYRLTVQAADGRTGTARTMVPSARTLVVEAPRRDSLRVRQGILVPGLGEAPVSVTLRYHVVVTTTTGGTAGDSTSLVVAAPAGDPVNGGWRVDADPQRDAPYLLGRLGVPASRVRLVRVTVEVGERSPEWAYVEAREGPHLDRLRGAFASLGGSRLSFVPAEDLVRAAGFRP